MGQVPENPSNPSIWAEFTEYKTPGPKTYPVICTMNKVGYPALT